MPVENHGRIINETAKEILSPCGIFRKGSSRIWIDDNGWFLTIIEFQPSGKSKGTYLNVGLFFLWTEQDYISFDFSIDATSRLSAFAEYKDDEQFRESVKPLVEKVLEKAMYYRKFKDLDYARKHFSNNKQRINEQEHMSHEKKLHCLLAGDKDILSTITRQREFWRLKGMKKLSA